MNYKYPKQAHLKSKKTIDLLFEKGKHVNCFPLRLSFIPISDAQCNQAGFAVAKRNFNKAVDRNRIKRQMREAYRLNQHLLSPKSGTKFALLFIYTAKESLDFLPINQAMIKLLKGTHYEDY
jgi:ribonuclease P protein component